MYETHFGLKHRPFRATPDSALYYPATGHEQALARILQAVAEDEGLVLVTGEPGTGKTLLAHTLIERLGPDLTCAFLTNSHLPDRTSLFQAILYDLSQLYEGRREQELRLLLTDYLLKNCQAGRRAILVVDEAQHLTPDLLEELRLLGNLETRDSKAFQVILAAQPRLEHTLGLPELAAFQQRLAVRARLEPLDVNEAADYLVHHLRAAGGRPEHIFTDEALEVLARGTRGVPRLLNQTAHHALTLAHAGDTIPADVEVALEALAAFGLQAEEGEFHPGLAPVRPPVAAEGPEEAAGALDAMLAFDDESAVPGDAPDSPPATRPLPYIAQPRRPA
jgi:type II secretory pathway predicted ATPase ExeA